MMTVVRQTFVDVEIRKSCARPVCPKRGRSFSDPCPPIPSPLDNEARPCTCNDRDCVCDPEPVALPVPMRSAAAEAASGSPSGSPSPSSVPPGCFQMPPGLFARREETRRQKERKAQRLAEEASSAAFDPPGRRTTLILKNLPPGSRAELLRLLDAEGFRAEYDFAYLPASVTTGGATGTLS